MSQPLNDSIENIVGKGENAGYQHFLLFPQCFLKPFSSGESKFVICVVKGSMDPRHMTCSLLISLKTDLDKLVKSDMFKEMAILRQTIHIDSSKERSHLSSEECKCRPISWYFCGDMLNGDRRDLSFY